MQLSDIRLTEIILDDPIVIKYFGEPVTFYIRPDQNITTYFSVYQYQEKGITNELMSVIKTIILNQDGSQLLNESETLPTIIVPYIVRKITEHLDQVRNQDLNPNGDWNTARLITIGAMAKEYGILPHVIRDTATTYDLMVYDVAQTWERYQYDKANGKTTSEPNLEQMKAMMAKVKGNTDE